MNPTLQEAIQHLGNEVKRHEKKLLSLKDEQAANDLKRFIQGYKTAIGKIEEMALAASR
jgi:hypothetical protein